MLLTFILGTRPEIIKLAPLIREVDTNKLCEYRIIHTNQHYDYSLDQVFFKELNLPQPHYNLRIGSGSHGEQTGKMMAAIEKVLKKEPPDWVIVQGDTNTVLAGILASSKLHIKTAHVEAGLRSFDRTMPEEINRVIADHISDMLFAPTETAKKHLNNEGITKNIYVTGNTIVDALFQHLEIAQKKATTEIKDFAEGFILATIHRDFNTDSKERLKDVLITLDMIANKGGRKVYLPAHPRTLNRIKEFRLQGIVDQLKSVHIIPPLGYLDFLLALSRASLVVTDSGGVQEEACIIRVPTITMRTSTERPETVEVGANILAPDRKQALAAAEKMLTLKDKNWPNPFGDGKAAKRCIYSMINP